MKLMLYNLLGLLIKPLFPIVGLQGAWLRWRVVRLPEAAGQRHGVYGDGPAPLRLLFLGDSSVAGVGTDVQENALAATTARELHALTQRPIEWTTIARNGATAPSTLLELLPQLAGREFDGVVLGLGMNHATQATSSKQWTNLLNQVINGIGEKIGRKPIYLSPLPPVYRFHGLPQPVRFYVGVRARIIDLTTAKVCLQHDHVAYLNITFPKNVGTLLASDGFHPGPKAYALWGQKIAYALANLPPVAHRSQYD